MLRRAWPRVAAAPGQHVAVVGAAMPDNLDHGPDYDTWQWVTTPRSDSGDPAHLLPLSLGIADTVPCGGARSKKQALGYQYAPYGIMVATCKANSIGLVVRRLVRCSVGKSQKAGRAPRSLVALTTAYTGVRRLRVQSAHPQHVVVAQPAAG